MRLEELSIIIPAYNEEDQISDVLRVLPDQSEIIMVDDASTDNTVDISRNFHNAKIVSMKQNTRKAGAMHAGLKTATRKYVMFVDADLTDLRTHHIQKLLGTVSDKRWVVGRANLVSKGKTRNGMVTAAQRSIPSLNGQQVATKETWDFIFSQIPNILEVGFGIEVVIEEKIKKDARLVRVPSVEWEGVSQVMKEEKHGFKKGFSRRLSMYKDIATVKIKKDPL